MMRYLPPTGTALTARSAASTLSRSPLPPASTSAIASRTSALPGREGIRRERRSYGAVGIKSRTAAAAAGRARELPAERRRDQVRGVEIGVVREVLLVARPEAVQVERVVDADVLVADAGAEGEILAVDGGGQREGVVVPVLEPGADVGGDAAHPNLGVGELAESPAQVDRPGQRVLVGGIEVERDAGVDGRIDLLADAVAPRQERRGEVVDHGAERDRVGRHVQRAGVEPGPERGDVLAGDRVRQALADELH